MFAGLLLIIGKGIYDLGGIDELFRINSQGGRLELFVFTLNPFIRQNFWSLVFGSLVSFLMPYCLDQQMVQRFSSAKSIPSAQMALVLNIPIGFVLISMCTLCGLVVYATYANCDPLGIPSSGVTSANQILPYFVIDKLGVIKGAAGVFLASILAGALSSVSSCLNSCAAILWGDFLKKFKYFKNVTDKKAAVIAKILVLLSGVISTIIAFMLSNFSQNLIQLSYSLNGSLNGPVVGVFLLGSLLPFSNAKGAASGLIAGFAMGLWLTFGTYFNKPIYPKLPFNSECNNSTSNYANYTGSSGPNPSPLYSEAVNLSGFNKFYSLSWGWFTTLGVLTTLIVGVIVSLLTNCNKNNNHEEYLLVNAVDCNFNGKKNDEINKDIELEKVNLEVITNLNQGIKV